MKNMFKAILSLFASSSVFAQNKELSVLFIGNSYTHMNDMPKIFNTLCEAEGLNVHVEKSALSGASFKVHSERNDLYETISSRPWDYVILQGYSRELTWDSSHIDSASIPYIDKIVRHIDLSNPNATKLFFMTWGYEDGFKEREEIDTYDKMTDTIKNGYQYLGRKYNFPVVPVGVIWKEVKQDSVIDLYAEDRAHPNKNGSYLIANTFFQSIFNVTAKPNLGIINEADALVIRETIDRFLNNENRLSYGLDKDNFRLDLVKEIDSSGIEGYRLNYSANFPDASEIIWNFGSDSLSNSNGVYYFETPGTYLISVRIIYNDGSVRMLSKQFSIYNGEKRKRKKKWFQFWKCN